MATDIHTLIGTFTTYLWPDLKKKKNYPEHKHVKDA